VSFHGRPDRRYTPQPFASLSANTSRVVIREPLGSGRINRESVTQKSAASTLTRPIPRRSSMPAACNSLATLERPKRCSIAKSFAESISKRFSDAPLTLAIRNDLRWSGVICERQLANCASPPMSPRNRSRINIVFRIFLFPSFTLKLAFNLCEGIRRTPSRSTSQVHAHGPQ
jgi:hypothetical protein